MKKTTLLILFLLALSSGGCRQKTDAQKEKENLLKTDTEFSNLSAARGMHEAFLNYADEKVVMLRPNGYPIEGKTALKEMYNKMPDTSFTLTWKPSFADVAESGESGYTYGIYELKIKVKEGEPPVEKGTYATFWKKDKAGNWKMVLDIGNEGLEPKKVK